MIQPSLTVICPGLQVAFAQGRCDERQPAHRAFEPSDPAGLLVRLEGGVSLHHVQHALDETAALHQESSPVRFISVCDRLTLVEQPVDALGQNIAELFRAGAIRIPERVIGMLDRLSGNGDWLQGFTSIQLAVTGMSASWKAG